MPGLVPGIHAFKEIQMVPPGLKTFYSMQGLTLFSSCPGLVPGIHALQNLLMAWTYILTNKREGTLYVGVTSDLMRRSYEHRTGSIDGFAKRYKLTRLFYFEGHETMSLAIQREKAMKGWPRAWKARLIDENNREWRDLFDEL